MTRPELSQLNQMLKHTSQELSRVVYEYQYTRARLDNREVLLELEQAAEMEFELELEE